MMAHLRGVPHLVPTVLLAGALALAACREGDSNASVGSPLTDTATRPRNREMVDPVELRYGLTE